MPSFKCTLPSSPLQPTSHEPVCLESSPRLTTFPINSCQGCRRGITESRQGLSYWHHQFIPTWSTLLSPQRHNLSPSQAFHRFLSQEHSLTAFQSSFVSQGLPFSCVESLAKKKKARLGFASKKGGVTLTLTLTQNCCDQLLFWTNGASGIERKTEKERDFVWCVQSHTGCGDEARTQSESFGTTKTIYGYSLLLSSINCLLGGLFNAFLGSCIMWYIDTVLQHCVFSPQSISHLYYF